MGQENKENAWTLGNGNIAWVADVVENAQFRTTLNEDRVRVINENINPIIMMLTLGRPALEFPACPRRLG